MKTEHRLNKVKSKPYLNWFRNELNTVNCKVAKWIDWDPDSSEYFANIEMRKVTVPIPECEWSFLVALHELGHVSTGYRLYSYLTEFNAELWAVKRAKDLYSIDNEDYIEDAKRYVKRHLVEDLLFSDLLLQDVKPYVLKWLDETPTSIAQTIVDAIDRNLVTTDFGRLDRKYWADQM